MISREDPTASILNDGSPESKQHDTSASASFRGGNAARRSLIPASLTNPKSIGLADLISTSLAPSSVDESS